MHAIHSYPADGTSKTRCLPFSEKLIPILCNVWYSLKKSQADWCYIAGNDLYPVKETLPYCSWRKASHAQRYDMYDIERMVLYHYLFVDIVRVLFDENAQGCVLVMCFQAQCPLYIYKMHRT